MNLVEHLHHPLVAALGWTVVHALWQFSLIALVWAMAMWMARHASPLLRYRISTLSMLSMPLVFAINLIRQYKLYQQASRIEALDISGISLIPGSDEPALYLLERNPGWLQGMIEPHLSLICMLYSLGLFLFILHSLLGYHRTHLLKTKDTRVLPAEWQAMLVRGTQRLGLKKWPRTRLSPHVQTPALIGLIKPVILIPLSMLSGISPAQAEMLILHELYHFRQKDHYLAFLQEITEILFFFHPMVWVIGKYLRNEREKSVDAWVVNHSGQALLYARALLELAEKRQAVYPARVAASHSKSNLFTRIKLIMTMKTNPIHPGKKMAAFLVLLASLLSIAWIGPSATLNHNESVPYSISPGTTAETADQASLQEIIRSLAPAQETPDPEPAWLRTESGRQIPYTTLSDADRQKIHKAIQQARLTVNQVNDEMISLFQSDDFQKQMLATTMQMQEMTAEMFTGLNINVNPDDWQQREVSEEVRREMEKARREIEKARQEIEKAREHFQSEEFQQEMEKARKEIEKARETFQSEEFRKEMEALSREINKVMEETDWTDISKEVNAAVNEAMKAVEEIMPAIHEMLKELKPEEWFSNPQDTINRP